VIAPLAAGRGHVASNGNRSRMSANNKVNTGNSFVLHRPADRTGEDLDMIYTHLKDLKAFEKFHPLLLQQICYYSFYEDLEQGVIRKSHPRCSFYRFTVKVQCDDI